MLLHRSSQLIIIISFGATDMLARSDSGRTNTDMSETSTTTEDYATATENNSGTDTSSKQLPRGDSVPPTGTASIGGVQSTTSAAGSSFESGSSLYSLARGDTEELPQVVHPIYLLIGLIVSMLQKIK